MTTAAATCLFTFCIPIWLEFVLKTLLVIFVMFYMYILWKENMQGREDEKFEIDKEALIANLAILILIVLFGLMLWLFVKFRLWEYLQ